jgi:hypothetical protein
VTAQLLLHVVGVEITDAWREGLLACAKAGGLTAAVVYIWRCSHNQQQILARLSDAERRYLHHHGGYWHTHHYDQARHQHL